MSELQPGQRVICHGTIMEAADGGLVVNFDGGPVGWVDPGDLLPVESAPEFSDEYEIEASDDKGSWDYAGLPNLPRDLWKIAQRWANTARPGDRALVRVSVTPKPRESFAERLTARIEAAYPNHPGLAREIIAGTLDLLRSEGIEVGQ